MSSDRYHRDPPRGKRSWLWLWLLLAGGGVMILACGGGFLLLSAALRAEMLRERERAMEEAEQSRVPRNAHTFEEFQALVGKAEAEAREAVGYPDRTGEPERGKTWIYDGVTDPATGKVRSLSVTIEGGKVMRVGF